MFINALNEESVVDEKMINSLELDYPKDLLNIVWVTDGSNDNTNQKLETNWKNDATVYFDAQRRGKTAAINRGMRFINAPIVVFTDANTMLNKEAIIEIVKEFMNPKVGCVAGEKRILQQSKSDAASGGEGIYWKSGAILTDLVPRLLAAVGPRCD